MGETSDRTDEGPDDPHVLFHEDEEADNTVEAFGHGAVITSHLVAFLRSCRREQLGCFLPEWDDVDRAIVAAPS